MLSACGCNVSPAFGCNVWHGTCFIPTRGMTFASCLIMTVHLPLITWRLHRIWWWQYTCIWTMHDYYDRKLHAEWWLIKMQVCTEWWHDTSISCHDTCIFKCHAFLSGIATWQCHHGLASLSGSATMCVQVCCSVLQCSAACCSVSGWYRYSITMVLHL